VVGSSGSQGTYGHERVIVIDDSYAPRMRRALRAHGLRSGELRRLGVGHFVLVVALIAVWTRESGPLVTAWTALVVGLPYGLLVWAAVRRAPVNPPLRAGAGTGPDARPDRGTAQRPGP
jgi:hypothetical protein